MEILVCVKRVPDSAENEIEVKADGSDIKRDDLVYSVNEWDNYAVEEAIQIVDRLGGSVTVASIGSSEAEEVVRREMAMGANKGVLLSDAMTQQADGRNFTIWPYSTWRYWLQTRKVDAAQIGHHAAQPAVDGFQQPVQAIPDLRHQRLAQVQHLKVDQPGHDDMRQDHELREAEQHQQDLQDRDHGALIFGYVSGSATAPKAQPFPQRFA